MKTIAWIPAGRTQYLKILIPYLLREKKVIQRIFLCLNTDVEKDVAFIKEVCEKYPDYFSLLKLEDGMKPDGRHTVYYFYRYFTDANTIYLKIDDDICFIEKGLISNLIRFRKNNPAYFLIYANLVNNVMCSYLHQHLGALNYQAGIYQWNPFCEIGWKSGEGAENTHECFLNAIKKNDINHFRFSHWEVPDFARISINLICYFGSDGQQIASYIEKDYDDEEFLSQLMPKLLCRINVIYGKKVGSHFAYFTQRDYLEQNTVLLERYARLNVLE